ncbi:hypothetical protein Glove_12g26 [Diversispora epigaea]|uniref:Zinc-ribbon domain-containing protein n=1 Tax=Diversispora epigaea TaxID=1348612 RepID=A0A397JXV7_9GLOM|nr:hypothetical protein Glove_12g26 [Diversispora epigaea]
MYYCVTTLYNTRLWRENSGKLFNPYNEKRNLNQERKECRNSERLRVMVGREESVNRSIQEIQDTNIAVQTRFNACVENQGTLPTTSTIINDSINDIGNDDDYDDDDIENLEDRENLEDNREPSIVNSITTDSDDVLEAIASLFESSQEDLISTITEENLDREEMVMPSVHKQLLKGSKLMLSSQLDVFAHFRNIRLKIPSKHKILNPAYYGIIDLTGQHIRTKASFAVDDWEELRNLFGAIVQWQSIQTPANFAKYFDDNFKLPPNPEDKLKSFHTAIQFFPERKAKIGYKVDFKITLKTPNYKLQAVHGEMSGGIRNGKAEACRRKQWLDKLKLMVMLRDELNQVIKAYNQSNDELLNFIVYGIQVIGFHLNVYAMIWCSGGVYLFGLVDKCIIPSNLETFYSLEEVYVILKTLQKKVIEASKCENKCEKIIITIWCPYCAGHVKLTLEDAIQIAVSKRGQCLSTEYVNSKSPMLCKTIFGGRGVHIVQVCHFKLNILINDAHRIAKSRNGLCLSDSFINSMIPLQWRWNARCTIEDARQVAQSRNGHCLSDKYINNNTKLQWRCIKGHEWFASFGKIKNSRSWCPECSHRKPYTLEYVKKYAYNKNGKCLSEKYINCEISLRWCCTKGHEWTARFNNIKNRFTWCPYCSKHKREDLCRGIISKYLGMPSNIRRPDFLKTLKYPLGLELDIYYPEYGFAIEVQGQQHEKYIEFFHRGDPINFIQQQARDQLKDELCEENWIVLRYVWYYEDPYIVIPEHLRELGLIE